MMQKLRIRPGSVAPGSSIVGTVVLASRGTDIFYGPMPGVRGGLGVLRPGWYSDSSRVATRSPVPRINDLLRHRTRRSRGEYQVPDQAQPAEREAPAA